MNFFYIQAMSTFKRIIVDKIDHRLKCGDSFSAVAMICKTLNQSQNKCNINLYNRILNFPNLPTDIETKLLT